MSKYRPRPRERLPEDDEKESKRGGQSTRDCFCLFIGTCLCKRDCINVNGINTDLRLQNCLKIYGYFRLDILKQEKFNLCI